MIKSVDDKIYRFTGPWYDLLT